MLHSSQGIRLRCYTGRRLASPRLASSPLTGQGIRGWFSLLQRSVFETVRLQRDAEMLNEQQTVPRRKQQKEAVALHQTAGEKKLMWVSRAFQFCKTETKNVPTTVPTVVPGGGKLSQTTFQKKKGTDQNRMKTKAKPVLTARESPSGLFGCTCERLAAKNRTKKNKQKTHTQL